MDKIEKIFFIRHGYRLDHADPTWAEHAKRPHDPPVSEAGMQQAIETGRYLKLQKVKIDHLFSSPFFRTLQTAYAISRQLNRPIKVEPGFSEWMNRKWYATRPEMLPILKMKELFPSIDLDYQSALIPKFPELIEKEDMKTRIRRVLARLNTCYTGHVMIVGHGATLAQIAKVLTGTTEHIDMNECAINVFECTNDHWELIEASSEHIQIPA